MHFFPVYAHHFAFNYGYIPKLKTAKLHFTALHLTHMFCLFNNSIIGTSFVTFLLLIVIWKAIVIIILFPYICVKFK